MKACGKTIPSSEAVRTRCPRSRITQITTDSSDCFTPFYAKQFPPNQLHHEEECKNQNDRVVEVILRTFSCSFHCQVHRCPPPSTKDGREEVLPTCDLGVPDGSCVCVSGAATEESISVKPRVYKPQML